jgi:PIN domain nuclease of toxin-antitoxin system
LNPGRISLFVNYHKLLLAITAQLLPANYCEVLSSATSQIYFSAASSWEIAIKHALGKIKLPTAPIEFIPQAIREMGFANLDITSAHALAAGELPRHHRDPFDRILISQARAEDLILLTADRLLQQYDVEIILCAA